MYSVDGVHQNSAVFEVNKYELIGSIGFLRVLKDSAFISYLSHSYVPFNAHFYMQNQLGRVCCMAAATDVVDHNHAAQYEFHYCLLGNIDICAVSSSSRSIDYKP
jgi:hypothetical protein